MTKNRLIKSRFFKTKCRNVTFKYENKYRVQVYRQKRQVITKCPETLE